MERMFTAFAGTQQIARGPIEAVTLGAKGWLEGGGAAVLVFDDWTGQQIDLDLRGSDTEALQRLAEHPWLREQEVVTPSREGPGRPKLGVVSREVSLLPRHWGWLNVQRGGASATLRRLVEERMKASEGRDRARQAHEAAAKFAWIVGGNLPHYEEAARALTRQDSERLRGLIADWPPDVRDHLVRLVEVAIAADEVGAHVD